MKTAFAEFRQLAEHGDAVAQYSLGYMYDNGKGVAEDKVEAVRWHRMAAEQGDTKAQNSLGHMHYNGEGVAKDDVEAVRWYLRRRLGGVVYDQDAARVIKVSVA